MFKVFKNIKDIEIGSHWFAIDGGSYGVRVLDKDLKVDDVIVEWFDIKDNAIIYKNDTHRIDCFKLQYRYYQKDVNPEEIL